MAPPSFTSTEHPASSAGSLPEAFSWVFERISDPLALVENALHEQAVSGVKLITQLGDHVLTIVDAVDNAKACDEVLNLWMAAIPAC